MRVAVWNTAFLGDAALTMPLIQVLKEARPDLSIDLYIRKSFAHLFEAQDQIDRIFEIDKNKESLFKLKTLYSNIASQKYDYWLSPHKSLRSSLASIASKAKIRAGYQEAVLSSFAYTHRFARNFYLMPEIERILQLLQVFNIQTEHYTVPNYPLFALSEKANQEANTILNNFVLKKRPILAIQPGSVWETKRWTSQGFAYVLDQALREEVYVLLMAGNNELTVAKEIVDKSQVLIEQKNPFFLNLSGQISLDCLLALISKSSAFLGNDSGPMHLAYLQGVKVTTVFGPTHKKFGFTPRGEHDQVIELENLSCKPCGLHGHHKCPKKHHQCMENINPEQVWQALKKQLF